MVPIKSSPLRSLLQSPNLAWSFTYPLDGHLMVALNPVTLVSAYRSTSWTWSLRASCWRSCPSWNSSTSLPKRARGWGRSPCWPGCSPRRAPTSLGSTSNSGTPSLAGEKIHETDFNKKKWHCVVTYLGKLNSHLCAEMFFKIERQSLEQLTRL